MVSTDLLRRYQFFALLDETQRKGIAAITEEVAIEQGTTIFEEGQDARALYVLMHGSVDLYLTGGKDPNKPLWVGQINPGEPFGISALIEPHVLTASARATVPSRALRIDGAILRAMCEIDPRLGHILARQVAKAAMERLHYAHVQLAAAQV
jgi:CRP-like cAMP-binding protein